MKGSRKWAFAWQRAAGIFSKRAEYVRVRGDIEAWQKYVTKSVYCTRRHSLALDRCLALLDRKLSSVEPS